VLTVDRHDDRGLTMVIVALLLVVLMVFAAFAVDLGGLYNARRQDQSAADSGATAGALDLDDPAAVLSQVDQRVSNTLDVPVGTLDWADAACSASDPDPVDTVLLVAGVSYPCITMDAASTAIQIKIPPREYPSVFGGIIGVDGYTHTAFAIAGEIAVGFGGVLPFGLPAAASGNNIACLKDGPHGPDDACDGPDTGHFGYLDFTFYGDTEANTTQMCSGGENERIANNIAVGVDHDLQAYTGAFRLVDGDECGALERRATSAYSNTGNRTSAFGAGIYSGSSFSDGEPGRLQRRDASLAGDEESVDGYDLDDNPLWDFIAPIDEDEDGVVEVPASCAKSIFDDAESGSFGTLPDSPADVEGLIATTWATDPYKAMRMLLDRCFTHYRGLAWDGDGPDDGVGPIGGDADPTTCPGSGCGDPVFAANSSVSDSPELYDIQYTPRFGYVPELSSSWGTPIVNPKTYDFVRFRAVFLQRLMGGCNASTCDLDFEPGDDPAQEDDAPNNGAAEVVTAWVFPSTMLPNGLAGESAPFELGVNRFVQLIR
jgi:hypothetical protein